MGTNLLKERLEEKNYTLKEFYKKSNIPLAYETVRYTIMNYKKTNIPTLMLIAIYLDFLPSEIRQMMRDKGDKDLYKLIGSDQTYLTGEEEVIISIYRKIKSKDKIIDHLSLVAKADGANVIRELNKLRRG